MSKWFEVCEGFEEILRWRLDTLSKKQIAKDLASNDLGIVDGSVVMH